jgi:hypothetical protein
VTPSLSYVIPCGGWRHIERVVGCLLAQDEAASVELVLVGPSEVEGELPADVRARFAAVKLVEADPRQMDAARAAGLLAANAPFAVIGETHCYPQPGYLRAIIAALEGGSWDGLAPQIVNANPATGLSWANLSLDYGPFLRPARGETDALPGQNAAVRTALLEPYRDELAGHMRMPYLFFRQLHERGARLFVEPAARSAHLNVTDRRAWLAERFGAGRTFATDRCTSWPRWRRALYTAGAPAIPLLRLRRALGDLRRGGGPLRAVPPLLAGLLASATGEAVGYAAPNREALPTIFVMELEREAFAPR